MFLLEFCSAEFYFEEQFDSIGPGVRLPKFGSLGLLVFASVDSENDA